MSEALIGGKYRLVRAIATGGMGTVHEAVHVGTQGRVAIKVLSDQSKSEESSRLRFAREAKASGRLRGRHVARVLDVDELEDGTPYMVMEYLEGHDLSKELKTRGPLPVAEIAKILVEAAAGVAEAHAAGIVHRDLKPANLFLAEEGTGHEKERVVKVLDFGISKVRFDDEEEITRTFATVGTPAYMSPEQIRTPREVDTASDVWSMGVILYRALAGRTPFSGNSSSVAVSICNDTPPPLSEVRSDVPPELVALIEKALEKDRRLRPSISEFAERLLPFAEGSATARTAFADIPASTTVSLNSPVGIGSDISTEILPRREAGRGRFLATTLAVGALTLLAGFGIALTFTRATPQPAAANPPSAIASSAPTSTAFAAAVPAPASASAAPSASASAPSTVKPSLPKPPIPSKPTANATENPAVPPRL